MNKQIKTMKYTLCTKFMCVPHTPPTVRLVLMLVPLKQFNIDKQTQKNYLNSLSTESKRFRNTNAIRCFYSRLNLNKNHMNYMTIVQYRN